MCNNMSEFSQASYFRRERESLVILSNPSPKRLVFDVKGNDDNRGSGR
jgi:hypothetical protein